MKYSEVHIFMCGYGTVLQEVVKWNYHYKNDMCHVLPYLFCGAGDQTQGFPCANQTICFLKRNIGPSIYLYMHVLVEMWYSGCLYHRKDLLFSVCMFSFFLFYCWGCLCVCYMYLTCCMCVYRWEVGVGFLRLSLYTLFLRQGLSSEPTAHWFH